MSQIYSRTSGESFGFDRRCLPVIEAISMVARRLWPVKTARQLAARAGTTHRAAEFWLSSQTGMNAEALAELLRSDAGREVLEAVMGDVKPSWWPAFKLELEISDLHRRAEEARENIEALQNALR